MIRADRLWLPSRGGRLIDNNSPGVVDSGKTPIIIPRWPANMLSSKSGTVKIRYSHGRTVFNLYDDYLSLSVRVRLKSGCVKEREGRSACEWSSGCDPDLGVFPTGVLLLRTVPL